MWNRVGVVTSFDEEEDDGGAATGSTSGIQAEFHDTTLHHSLHLNNATGFSMADLSLTALMLATTVSFIALALRKCSSNSLPAMWTPRFESRKPHCLRCKSVSLPPRYC